MSVLKFLTAEEIDELKRGMKKARDENEKAKTGCEKAKAVAMKAEAPEKSQKCLKVLCMADVEPEHVQWVWFPYLPAGKVTLLEGDPGSGKTWLALAIASAVSTGAPFPNTESGRLIGRREPGNVIYLSAEDGPADTLRPRLDMVQADVKNIYVIAGTVEDEKEELFSFDDLALLDLYAEKLKPKLVVVDPLQAYLGANIDMHRANETRPVLARLAVLADRHECAVVCIRHLSKASTSKGIYRGMGSIDFTAAARSVLLAGSDSQDPRNRGIVHLKSSLAPAGAAQGYELRDGFFWTGISDLTASKILGSEIISGKKTGATDEVAEWLQDVLSDGPLEKKEIEQFADDAGFTKMTLRRAREKLEVKTYKKPGEKNGPYLWELPKKNSQVVQVDKGKLSNPTTRNFSSNDAGFTGCSGKNGEQTVEVNNDKDFGRNDGLFNIPLEENIQLEQTDKEGEGYVSIDDLELD